MATIKDLMSWIERDITRFSNSNNYIEIVPPSEHFDLKIRIYTDIHQYSIVAREQLTSDSPRSYLGCMATCRKPRAGETWTRGNDLTDGELSFETWHSILGDIISYEMVKVHKPE